MGENSRKRADDRPRKSFLINFVNFHRIQRRCAAEFCLIGEKKRILFCINKEKIESNWNVELDKKIRFEYNGNHFAIIIHMAEVSLLVNRQNANRRDEKQQRSFVMTQFWKKVQAFATFLHSRTFTVGMLSIVCAFVVVSITSMTNAVYVTRPEGRTLDFLMSSQPERIMDSVGLSSLSPSEVTVEGASSKFIEMEVSSPRTVTVEADGKVDTYEVEAGKTVGELLYEKGITYDGNDLLTPSAEKPLEVGEKIVLQRVDYEQYQVEEIIPYDTVYKNTSLLKLGRNNCIQTGENGLLQKTYTRRTVDGVKEEEQLLGEQILKHPVKETILVGSVSPISDLDFNLELDKDGRPLHYSKLLEHQDATGYSARDGAKTASGRYAMTGHVAVDPREIPYGSKLYIVSPDNKFIYGCAVAADTGTGLMADVIDVDLFYDTYQESVLNGRRTVDIYVLD